MASTTTINPSTGEKIADYNRLSINETKDKIAQSRKAYESWKQKTYEERAQLMHKLADVLDENKEEYAQLATREMGKTIGQSRKEIEKCALVCRYYADNSKGLLSDEIVKTEATKSYVTFQPIGVVLAVMPWNFPFYQVIRFAAPALMAGNTGVLKHASNVQGCAFALEDAFTKAGFPVGAFTNLNIDSKLVKDVIEDKNIVAVTLTGSDPAGRSVASIAGQNLKKTVMELGGSDAYIILDDVDMQEATDLATLGRLQNNGQTCIAAKRFVVLDKIYDEFLALFTKKMKAAKMGEPTAEDSYYGPMARFDLRDELHEQVLKTIAQGGRLVLGGEIPLCKGAYYPATILADLELGMEGFDNELFGPVASVIRAKDDAHAVELANNSQFGLGSGVFTGNNERGEKLALQLEAGSSFVNKLVVSDPRLPFGGIKNSGYGRELAAYGIREFVNTKTIWIK
ncbi:NAD-dependent succinate-semialdehyde dehydrogenase [Flavobacterium degerlachei]|jgi:succinate-semialdehyde dehydrogenase/glutarate-semialdehyde dehydrogenase|uniref:Succinate-semialdehyde dehydrogenase / glutarate-semialdehyde dehydrogenase n=1 Tax=Flavobacterium degerlachei TaxID=229203 RepID=A0A1H3EWS8_9FLAO|nr:NAD-dependent succinate-semialdehyde dehydrogenase [Flavobacterium degerlachei]SDX82538.1 succinate-semialdehyde dehydrogenase / glutarate-semialdehyde dehydrogenase [Flavobacterium degerlachei]